MAELGNTHYFFLGAQYGGSFLIVAFGIAAIVLLFGVYLLYLTL